MLQIAELSRTKEVLKEKAVRALADAGVSHDAEGDKSDRVRIVFAGQYSAGKSSIIKMITGDETVATGAKITTEETHAYEWNGLEIVDTPGVHTTLRPDHDEISYNAIAAADILVFVVTNELFDSYMADHFRRLAIDKDKAGEMILVVNKMDRAAGGNSAEQQEVIREGLRSVLAPYTPEQLHLSFLDAQSYLDSLEEREEDPELADELLKSLLDVPAIILLFTYPCNSSGGSEDKREVETHQVIRDFIKLLFPVIPSVDRLGLLYCLHVQKNP